MWKKGRGGEGRQRRTFIIALVLLPSLFFEAETLIEGVVELGVGIY